MKKKVALVQMEVVAGDPKVNFARVAKWVEDAAHTGADVIMLPELWDTGFALEQLHTLADRDSRATTEFLSDLAKQLNIAIIGGSIAEETENGITNTMLVINNNGDLIHKNNKKHLSENERSYVMAGEEAAAFDLDGVKSTGFIGQDIRYIDNTNQANESKVMYVVAACPENEIGGWQAMLKDHAADNQCFVIACNRAGEDSGQEFGGKSLIVDPSGVTVVKGSSEETMLLAEIDVGGENHVWK